ncbi:MAG: MCE family protein [Spirochaetes bacterium]|nr:MCE family protein [Spirochaetota bacterium]
MATKASRIIRVIIISIIAIGTSVFLYLMINNFQFSRGTSVKVLYERIGALNIGTWVRKSGVKVGSVTKIEINKADQRSVYVTVTMRPGEIVREKDQFAIVVRGLMGDQYIEIFPGPLDSPSAPDGYIFKGEPMLDTSSLLTTGIGMLNDIGKSIKIVAGILADNKTSIENTIINIEKTSKNLNKITEQSGELTDTIPQITSVIKTTLARINSLTASLQKNIGDTVESENKNLSETLDNLNAITKSVKKTVDSLTRRSSFIDTISNPKLSKQIEDTMNNLQQVSENIVNITGSLQKTLNDILGSVNTQ